MESAPVSPRRHSVHVNRSGMLDEDRAGSPAEQQQQQKQQQKQQKEVGSGALGKKGSLVSLLGQNVWPTEDLKAMDPERGNGGYETEHRTGPRRRRSSFLQNMSDYLAYSSTLESNSDRPQGPIPQGPPSRRGSWATAAHDHEQDDLDDDITPEEAAMYSTQSANARRASVALIVSESSVAASAATGAVTRPAAEHVGHHHHLDEQPSNDEKGTVVEEAEDDARLLNQAFTFAPVDDEARAASPRNHPATHSPTNTDSRGARSPGLRRRRRASVSTPFGTITEEGASGNRAMTAGSDAAGNGKPMYLPLPSSPLCQPQSPLDFPTPKPQRGKKTAPKPQHLANTTTTAATAATNAGAATATSSSSSSSSTTALPTHAPMFKASSAMVGLPRAREAETMAPLSQQEVVALRQLYERLHEEQQELLREARFHRRAELLLVSALTATATALAVKYLL